MNHVAVDLGSRKSQFCVRNSSGTILWEGKVANLELRAVFKTLEGKSRIVVETCAEAFAVADMGKEAGHEVTVVPATLAPSLGVGQRGVKTDKKDAQNLALASCRMEELPNVHCPSVATRDARARLTARGALIEARTKLINCVRGLARGHLITISSGKSGTFAARARAALLENSWGLAPYVEHLLKTLESLSEQIALADKALKRLAEQDTICIRLMTVPGVGPVTALSFVAAIDDVERFKSAAAVGSYLGLTPGENSSGTKTSRTGITKAGASRVRWALIQAAWAALRCRREDPMVKWANGIAERRPRQVAVTALARKISGILFALWRDGTTYDAAYQS